MEVIEKEHLIRPANQRWKLLCAMIGHVKYTQSKAGFCKEINNVQFIISEPIVEIQVATKIPLVSWFKGTPIPKFVLRLIESSLNQRNSRYPFEVFICFCLELVFFLYTVLREHRVCYAENNRNNEKEVSNAKRRREKLKPDQNLTQLR